MAASVDFVAERSLLDAKFDGYKLSLDAIPCRSFDLKVGVAISDLQDAQFSLQHIKTFGLHNHLQADPWDQSSVYVVTTGWAVLRFSDSDEKRLTEPDVVLQIPRSSAVKTTVEKYNIALSFASEQFLVIADGEGSLYLVETGSRSTEHESGKHWKIVFHAADVVPDGEAFGLRDSTYRRDGELQIVDCILPHIEQKKDNGSFVTILEWVTFSHDGTGTALDWKVHRRRTLEGRNLEYAGIDRHGDAIYVVSDLPFSFTYDSLVPIAQSLPPSAEDKGEDEKRAPAYTWIQSQEDITIHFTVPPSTYKHDINVTFTSNNLTVALVNTGVVLLEGALFDAVRADECTWTLSDQRLEVFLCKRDSSVCWSLVVTGDGRGEMVLDPEEAARIHERLQHLTSSSLNADPSRDDARPYNAQQLEECDATDGENLVLARWDGDKHMVTHQANLGGHQWLFSSAIDGARCPVMCLRHDVDGLVWEVGSSVEGCRSDSQHCPWRHIGTFNAFGYVIASKRSRKFTSCAPNFSYVAVAECSRHVYVYRQPERLCTELRNRKTGRGVAAVAKQHVVAFASADTILGFHTADQRIFVLTASALYVLLLN